MATTSTTQKEIVLNHLNEFGSITSMEAIEQYRITRLAHHIWDLKENDKVAITMTREKVVGRTGRFSSYGVYRLAKAGE